MLLVCCVAGLGACESLKSLQPIKAAPGEWALKGRLGYRSPEHNGSVVVTWHQKDDVFDLTFRSSLGLFVAHLAGPVRGPIELTQAGAEPVVLDNPEAATARALGVGLPLTAVSWWIRGAPAPGRHAALGETFADGFVQRGWTVTFGKYLNNRPGRITLTRESWRFVLVIREWEGA